jgi:hypothetical protein
VADFLADFRTQTQVLGWYGFKSPSKVQRKLKFFSIWVEPEFILEKQALLKKLAGHFVINRALCETYWNPPPK